MDGLRLIGECSRYQFTETLFDTSLAVNWHKSDFKGLSAFLFVIKTECLYQMT